MTPQVLAYPIYEIGQRSNQEDCLFPSPDESPSRGLLYILCDGMGGHADGELASRTVCKAMSEYILSHPSSNDCFDKWVFNEALEHAYSELDSKDTDDVKKMGTTLAFAKIHTGGCFVAHIGDSRIYHIRPSSHRILYVSRDHSLVNELVELGEMTLEEAKSSPQKNVITRAMQPHQESPSKADCINLIDLRDGDYIFLCSDGMLEQMDDRELVDRLSCKLPDSSKISLLRKLSKDNKDNHSAWLIHVISTYSESKGVRKCHFNRLLLTIAIAAIIGLGFFFLCFF